MLALAGPDGLRGVVPLLSHENVGTIRIPIPYSICTIRIPIPLLCQRGNVCTLVHHMHKLAIGAMICFFDYALCTHDLLVTDNGRTRRLHARQVSMQTVSTLCMQSFHSQGEQDCRQMARHGWHRQSLFR